MYNINISLLKIIYLETDLLNYLICNHKIHAIILADHFH